MKRHFHVIKMPSFENLGEAVASHPDMLLFADGDTLITSAEYLERYPYIFSDIRERASISMTFTSDTQKKEYPGDAIFNALVCSGRIFLKEDTVSDAVKEYAKRAGLSPVSVKQGYPACTSLAFGNSAITADRGMAKVLRDEGINVTLILDGDISLPPYEYGFIGGCAGVLGNTVYFLGDLSSHRDHIKIEEALRSEGFDFVSLSDEPLRDLGRIIFIKEDIDKNT